MLRHLPRALRCWPPPEGANAQLLRRVSRIQGLPLRRAGAWRWDQVGQSSSTRRGYRATRGPAEPGDHQAVIVGHRPAVSRGSSSSTRSARTFSDNPSVIMTGSETKSNWPQARSCRRWHCGEPVSGTRRGGRIRRGGRAPAVGAPSRTTAGATTVRPHGQSGIQSEACRSGRGAPSWTTTRPRVDRDTAWAFLSAEAYWAPVADPGHLVAATGQRLAGGGRRTERRDRRRWSASPVPVSRRGGVYAYLADVYVDQRCRSQGLGAELVAAMIEPGPGRLRSGGPCTPPMRTGSTSEFGFTPTGPAATWSASAQAGQPCRIVVQRCHSVRPSASHPGRLSGGVALEDQPQADQGQPRLVGVDDADLVDDQRGEAAGGDDGDRLGVAGRQLRGHPPGDALDLAGEAEDDAGLQRLDGVLADHPLRPGQFHLEQLRGPPGQRVHRDLDARGERPADELAAAR